jgi:hypothetical protein
MLSGSVGHATQTTMLHHVHRKTMSMLQQHALWKCSSCYTSQHPASCAGTEMLSLPEKRAPWKCWSCYTDHHPASCAWTQLLSLLGLRACILEALVLLHKPQCCIMCSDTNAALGTRACTLEVLVLLNKPILHYVQGHSCCPYYKSMHAGSVGPATQTAMHHVQ